MKNSEKSLNLILNCKSSGNFINEKGEYCRVSSCYIGNNRRIQIIFSKDGKSSREAITTSSEKKCIKLLNDDGFKLI
jgi:hypothetical protein